MEARILQPTSSIGHLVVRDAVRVAADRTIAEVAIAMREANVSSVLVGQFGAIATERDITRGLAIGITGDDPIDAIASPHAIRVDWQTSVVAAAAMMLNQEVRHLVVDFEDGRDGVISLREVLAVLLQGTSPDLWLTSLRAAVTTPAEIWLG